ncbi:uncharacterized protein DUF4004 [Paenibacillus cellulosilyticus]|uniref:Uncharacterized protein DUF4004 n=1 Tax=Paenibacillus cellulosilyticus TaxID=375489 RepID=A0A2V2YEC9_9BACL|nr:DUF4004 family protein [Paenibacillus cellulosilyticus]PWV90655.1 uncharacterized protein DUF4004 [Paenibacillus cellulosilyticus]QKS43923.1 DUF4004 family protein [Paenibacillus cellulosilyticus]
MEQELISKKDLLEEMGISYGQLYRWKRKRLIPEEWFIRKSTFTGQETFFPKGLILGRISHILSMKDDLSLDELVGKLSTLQSDIRLRIEEMHGRIVSPITMDRYAEKMLTDGTLAFDQAFYLFVADWLHRVLPGGMTEEEGARLIKLLVSRIPQLEERACNLVVLQTAGKQRVILLLEGGPLHTEESTVIAASLSIDEAAEAFKAKLYAYE